MTALVRMTTMREQFAQTIAAKAFHNELAASLALGHPEITSFTSAFRAMDGAYNLVFAKDMPHLTLPARMIGNSGCVAMQVGNRG